MYGDVHKRSHDKVIGVISGAERPIGGYSIMVIRDLPKVEPRVRFPLPAPKTLQNTLHTVLSTPLDARATLAQLVEQCFRKAEVRGSTPRGGSIKKHMGNHVFFDVPMSAILIPL